MAGGRRLGAGRPLGKGPYGEKTQPIRIPQSLIPNVMKIIQHKGFLLPIFEAKVPAGFPSALEDPIEDKIDLNEFLIKHPSATFLVRVSGYSMIDAGIRENDVLIVDRSIKPTNGKIVVAAIDGHLTVKYLKRKSQTELILLPANKECEPIVISEGSEVIIWGVVTSVIHQF